MNTVLLAARNPLFLAVLVVAIVTGLFIELWLLPLGVVIYIAAVALAASDPALRTRSVQRVRQQTITSLTFRTKLQEIERARDKALDALNQTGGPVAQQLLPTVEPQTRELVEQAYTLSQKGQDIERYLQQVNYTQLQDQINQIDQRIDRTSDTYTIEQLQSTRQALVAQQDSARALETYIGRIKSQLDNIDANLDAMPAQFIRMQASDVDSTIASSQVEKNLRDLNADMHAFVSVLDTALGQTGAVPSR